MSFATTFDDQGRPVPVTLVPDGAWQQTDLALLDFETGADSCANGTVAVNTTLRVRVPERQLRGLQFTLGVPFDRNHADPLTAVAPLDDAAMHWHWRSGYKFLRAGVRSADDGFWIHVGSTACKGTVQNITGCDRPNRVTVSLPDFVPGFDTVVIDLSELLAETNLADGVRSDCSSGPAEDSCAAPFDALGIEFGSGNDIGQQQVFKRRAGH
ncbi:MAG: metallo-mystery pair system four-Cys motif protein [Woeseiaceae bacterium]